MSQSFSNFVADERSEPIVNHLKEVCRAPAGVRSPIVLSGRPGVGKSHLCRAMKNEGSRILICTSEDLISALITSIKTTESLRVFFETFQGFHLIVDDADLAFRGDAVQQAFAELIERQKQNGNFVLLTCAEPFPVPGWLTEELQRTLEAGISFRLAPPDRAARLRYCREKLLACGVDEPDTAAEIVDAAGDTIPRIDGAINGILAARALGCGREINVF